MCRGEIDILRKPVPVVSVEVDEEALRSRYAD
jgi:hypothetical protein